MDYFSRKPDFPTFEDIYIARAQGAIELERRGDEVACRFGPDGPAFMLPQGATRGDIIRGCLACDGIVGALRENAGMRSAAAGWLDSYFTEVAGRAPVGETCSAGCLFACHVDIDGIYAERTGDPDGLRAYCDPMGVGWNYGPIYYFPRESIEQIVAQLIDDGDDFPVLFDGERVIEAFDGSPVHMSVPVEVDGEKVWTCGYDFCWGETVAPDEGELIATPFAGGISVDINLPDGKGSGQLAFIESTPAELQDDYPTPVHVFSYDGRDSEPVHRTDVHLDGDAMTLDPVKGTPAHNGAQAHGGDRHPADLAKAASAAANRTAGSRADEAGGIKH